MGGHLRSEYGSEYVNLGFLFGRGSFNAVSSASGGLQVCTVGDPPTNSIEAIFTATGAQLLMLDTREIASGGGAAAPLLGPIPARSIGSTYNSSAEQAYFQPMLLPDDFDLLIYLSTSSPSTLL